MVINLFNKATPFLFLLWGVLGAIALGKFDIVYAFFIVSSLISSGFLVSNKKKGFGKTLFFINLTLWLNLLGEVYFYASFQYYDKILHFIVPLMLVYVLRYYYPKEKKINVFIYTVSLLILFEFVEWLIQLFLGVPMMGVISQGAVVMGPVTDTIVDVALGVVAALLYLQREKIN